MASINPLTGQPYILNKADGLSGGGSRTNPLTGQPYVLDDGQSAPFHVEPTTGPDEVTDGTTLADYGKSIMSGGAGVGAGLGWLIKQVSPEGSGLEDFGSAIQNLGSDAVDYWNDSMSDAAKDELAKEFVTKDDNGEWQWGDASLNTVGLLGAQSLLGTAAGAGAGAGVTKVLQAFGNPIGRQALIQAVQAGGKAAPAAAKKLKLIDRVMGAAGFGLGEGTVGGIMTGVNVESEVMRLSPDKLMNNARFMQIFDASDGLMDENQRFEYAKATLASEASTVGGFQAGLTTALLGAPMGAYLGPLFSRVGAGRSVGVLKGAAGEAAQEFAQGAAEGVIVNKELIKAGDTRGLLDDVLNQAIGGAAAGAPIGGVFGLSDTGAEPAKEKKPSATEAKAAPGPLEPLKKLGDEAIAAGATEEEVRAVFEDATQPGRAVPALKVMRDLAISKQAEKDELERKLQEVEAARPQRRKGGRRRKTPAEPSRPASVPIDEAKDSLLQAVSKMGGLSREEAEAEGIDPADFSHLGSGIKRVFTEGGIKLDEAAERLAEAGYPVIDENGNYDRNKVLALVDSEIRGETETFTPAGQEHQMELMEFERKLEQYEDADVGDPDFMPELLADEAEYDPGADEQARKIEDLYTLAALVDENAADSVLEKAESDREAAEQLWEIANGQAETKEDEGLGQPGEVEAEAGLSAPVDTPQEEGATVGEELAPVSSEPKSRSEPKPTEYKLSPQKKWPAHGDFKAQGGTLEDISPKDFLAAAAPLEMTDYSRQKIDMLKARIQEGGDLDPLMLRSGSEVQDSDGRHRAIAAQELGIETVPVVDFRNPGPASVESTEPAADDSPIGQADQTAATPPVPEAPRTTVFEGSDISITQDFGNLELTEEVEVEDTGDVVTLTTKAKVDFRRAVKRQNGLEKLLECVNAS